MDSHSVDVPHGRVDVPLRVFEPGYYHTLVELYGEIEVATQPVDYTASFRQIGRPGVLQYANRWAGRTSIPSLTDRGLLADEKPAFVRDFTRFFLDSARRRVPHSSLGTYLADAGYTPEFVDIFLLPTLASICTCSYESILAYPAPVIAEYMATPFTGLRRVLNGTQDVVERLARDVHARYLETAVVAVRRTHDGALVETAGAARAYDAVVLATPADAALRLLADATAGEREALESFRYERSRVVVHGDPALMPPDRADWATVNFAIAPDRAEAMATIWMNAAQPSLGEADVFQTWNPLIEADPATVVTDVQFDRSVVDARSERGIALLERLHRQPGRRVWICGSYAASGIPLQESAARSARRIAEALGAVPTRAALA
jgi:predicted NAD/FAD-binding protein